MKRFQELVEEAINEHCSDMYVLPYKNYFRVMVCVNGEKRVVDELTKEIGQQMIAYFKYRGNMTVSEHRRPQIGALRWPRDQNCNIDLRLSSVGNYKEQESLVIRFIYPLKELKYQLAVPEQWQTLNTLTASRGLILFAGPMGSGKTTTMYRLAKELARRELVMTIEDPVEIEEPHFLQLQVNESAGMDYLELLKVGLRHRPDNFIIGEIRDPQTAKMAVQAALSGHLVLATVHAISAGGVVARLQQLGVEQYYLQQVLTGICYQRLLPLKTGQAVLFDLLYGNDLHAVIKQKTERGMSDEWQANLETLLRQRQITTTTFQQYAAG